MEESVWEVKGLFEHGECTSFGVYEDGVLRVEFKSADEAHWYVKARRAEYVMLQMQGSQLWVQSKDGWVIKEHFADPFGALLEAYEMFKQRERGPE